MNLKVKNLGIETEEVMGIKATPEEFNPIRVSEKSCLALFLFFWFIGMFGAHRYYAGKIFTGLLFMFTLGLFGLWAIIDFILIISGNFKDKKGLKISKWINK